MCEIDIHVVYCYFEIKDIKNDIKSICRLLTVLYSCSRRFSLWVSLCTIFETTLGYSRTLYIISIRVLW